MDRYGAAGDIYVQLKRQARSRYRKVGFDIVVIAAGALAGVHPGVTSSMLAASNGASLDDIIVNAGINVVTGGLFETFRINPKTLLSIDTVRAMAVHGTIGCLSGKAGRGSCSKGSAAAVGSNNNHRFWRWT